MQFLVVQVLLDLLAGITHVKHANLIINHYCRKQTSLVLILQVISCLPSSGVEVIDGMTEVERHAACRAVILGL